MGSKLKLLKERNYIGGGSLTEKGRFAKTVYGYELILSELYEKNLFAELDEFGLGALAAAVVFEPRRNQEARHLTKIARHIDNSCGHVYRDIRRLESRYGIYPLSKPPYFHLAQTMEHWMRGGSFADIMRFTDTDEGEIVRYFRMAVQILREIDESGVSSHILKDNLRRAIRLINRDVVDAEKQLREG
jgi:ATP-dependent RNA helicase HelY